MLGKTILILVILGSVSSDPVRRSISIPNDVTSILSDYAEQFEIAVRPETIRSMGNLVKSAIGFKLSALAIAVKCIHWLKSNLIGIAIGGIIALGFCKITGKCNLNYDHTISKLSSIITPERLKLAQNLFINALRRFGEDNEEYEEEEEEDNEIGYE